MLSLYSLICLLVSLSASGSRATADSISRQLPVAAEGLPKWSTEQPFEYQSAETHLNGLNIITSQSESQLPGLSRRPKSASAFFKEAAQTDLPGKLEAFPTEDRGAARLLLQDASSTLCGSKEYYCGDVDLILDVAYTAATTNSCSLDSDLQLYICNDYVLTPEAYAAVQSNKGSCLETCALSSIGIVVASQYYWVVTAWDSCSAACDSGVQNRVATCMNSMTNMQAGANLCDVSSKPTVRQACNSTPCQVVQQGLTLNFTSWSECNADCGPGFAVRDAFCTDPSGALADASACSSYSGTQLSQDCSTTACTAAHWVKGPWSACSATCGGGNATRSMSCIDGSGKPANDSLCTGQPAPPSSRVCETAPCAGYTWEVGPWGECDLACNGGIQNRTVTCINQYGSAVNASLCPSKVPADELQCNVLPCNFCSQTTCAGQGVCKNGVCVCQPGYRGSYCEIAPQCTGILDAAGNCCQHGVVDVNGTCCSSNAVLDASAQCCNSGKRDACGVCDGSALVVDVQNTCCGSGVLDAAGYCCASGALDECGVCDGDSQSCALSAVVNVQVSTPSSFFSLGPQAFVSTFADFMSEVLAVNSSHVDVADYVLAPGVTIDANDDPVEMDVAFNVVPADSFSTPQDLRASLATRNLQDAVGQASANSLFILTALPIVQRSAICGNQVCEPGERVPPGATVGCPGDCPFELQACPAASTNSTPCTGNGRCLSASGSCICFLGYDGNDCSTCAEGYIQFGGSCARYVKADLPLLNSSSSANVLIILAIGISLAVLGGVLLALAAAIIVRQRRQLRGYRRMPRSRSSLKVPLKSADSSKNGSGKRSSRASKAKEEEDDSGGDDGDTEEEVMQVEVSPSSLFHPEARAKSVMDVARMHVESLSAMRTKSSTTPANRKMVTIRSSGRLRPVPKQRSAETTPSPKKSARTGEAQAAASEAAEKAALRRLLKLLDPIGKTSRRLDQEASFKDTDPSPVDALCTIELSAGGAICN